ncbi:hypothetical protein J6590_061189 [Homalodisca vitripennis]|nr:hypothetical protein J6590_061189 [Homalodisca vitripennis]
MLPQGQSVCAENATELCDSARIRDTSPPQPKLPLNVIAVNLDCPSGPGPYRLHYVMSTRSLASPSGGGALGHCR